MGTVPSWRHQELQTCILWETNQCLHPLGCFSLLGCSSFALENAISHEKQWIFINTNFLPTQSYWSNIFSSLECTWMGKLFFQHFILLKAKNIIYFYSLFLHELRLNSWVHILLYLIYQSIRIKQSNRFLFSKLYNIN